MIRSLFVLYTLQDFIGISPARQFQTVQDMDTSDD